MCRKPIWYMNAAWAAKWLNYESGETAAFKVLASVYPSKLNSTEMKALADASLNYFITVGTKNISMNGKVVGDEVGRRYPVPGLAEERYAGPGREPVRDPVEGACHRQRHWSAEPDARLPEGRAGCRRYCRRGVRRR